MADQTLERLALLRGDLAAFGRECLKVRTKEGESLPFLLNPVQQILHERLEAQRRETGWVRAIVLKGRQQGVSTYTAARFYQKTSLRKGINTYILAHEQPASDTLFGIVDRYQRNNALAPHVGTSNAKELVFDRLDSSYSVATAGSKAGGRSKAITLFHGSEVAFWANAKDHFAASVQGVPLAPGTEIILESTSAGGSGEFYNRWADAEAGVGDYIPIFLEWWLTSEYQRTPEPGFVLSNAADADAMSEQEYADTFRLSLRQMAWRRGKIQEIGATLFRREYPATPSEAWTTPEDHVPYIMPLNVLRARKRKTEGVGPLIVGVDPASGGGDRFSVAWRRGLSVERLEFRNRIDHNEGTAWIREIIERDKPSRVCIDAGNIGATIVTNLKSLGPRFAEIVRGVNFGGTSDWRNAKPKVPGPYNRRAEMWMRLRDWLASPEGVSIPDDQALETDIVAPKQKPRLDGFFYLESKIDMKSRGVRSPDLADAVALTFAFMEFFESWSQPSKAVPFGNVDTPRPDVAPMDLGLSQSPSGWMM